MLANCSKSDVRQVKISYSSYFLPGQPPEGAYGFICSRGGSKTSYIAGGLVSLLAGLMILRLNVNLSMSLHVQLTITEPQLVFIIYM